jgi:hypothetical protein
MWSFDLGLFHAAPATGDRDDCIAIERWRRDRGDDRDVYRVRGSGRDLVLSSRTAAILEGYRQARRGLYRWSDGRLWRQANGGHLPLVVARALRCSSLVSAGPVATHGEAWTYGYAAELADAQWLTAVFGSAVEVSNVRDTMPWMQPRIRTRRMGLRLTPTDLFRT